MYCIVVICFQLVLSFMACLESCIGHISQLSLTDELSMSNLHSLPSAVIQTVKTAFKHCKVPYMVQYFCFVEVEWQKNLTQWLYLKPREKRSTFNDWFFIDISAWSLDVLSLYSTTLLIVDTMQLPPLFMLSVNFILGLCVALWKILIHIEDFHTYSI